MARNPELDSALGALDTATNTLGAGAAALATAFDGLSTRVFALTEKINTRMTDEEVAAVRAALDAETNRIDNGVVGLNAIATAMNGLASDPTAPVPEEPPAPVEELPSTPVV